ncbi:MAG: DUF2284 domain-containing protein [Eubacteriaceae bacterium]
MATTKDSIEKKIGKYPILEYAFFDPLEINFYDAVRTICEIECPQYGQSWSCPPGVGTVEECKQRCLKYKNAFIFSTISEVQDIFDMEETISTCREHIEIVEEIKNEVFDKSEDILILTAESCKRCEKCTYPEDVCLHLDKMYPCIESHGISVTNICERMGLSFLNGHQMVTWFSLIFF